MAFQLVHPTQVDQWWPHIGPLIQKAVDKQGLGTPMVDYFSACRRGENYLFVWVEDEIKTAVIIEFFKDIKGSAAIIAALGTSRKMTWPDDMEPIFQFVKDQNINRVFAKGRLGWARAFKKAKVISQTYEMEL